MDEEFIVRSTLFIPMKEKTNRLLRAGTVIEYFPP